MTASHDNHEPETRAVRLARARQHLAYTSSPINRDWADLTPAEQRLLTGEAQEWIAAAAAAGLMHAPGPGPDDEEELPRRRLDETTDRAVYDAITYGAADHATTLPHPAVHDIATAVCNRLGILTAPPDPEPDTCTAQIPDAAGWWLQCTEEVGHDPTQAHDAEGEMVWRDHDHEAVPARPTTEETA